MAAGERDDHRSDSGPLRDVSGVFTKSDFKIDPSQLQFFGKVVLLIDPSQLQFFGKWCSSTGPRTPPTPRSPTGPQPVRHLHEGRGLDIERKKTSATSYRILVRGVDIDVLIGK